MQRIQDIKKWKVCEEGSAIVFGASAPRRVRLDVNSHAEVRLTYADGNGELVPLALVKGRDVIEFQASGEFSIIVDGGPLWYYTIDGQKLAIKKPDAVSFTRIIERRPRNPEVELMNYLMNQNMERRFEQQRVEFEAMWARREAAATAAAAQSEPSGDAAGAGTKPVAAKRPAAGGSVDNAGDGGSREPPAEGKQGE